MKHDEIADDVLGYIREKYPEIHLRDFLRKEFSRAILGDIPDYSGRKEKGYHICPVTTVTVSSFAVCYGFDVNSNDWVFVATRKLLEIRNRDRRISLLGGFANLDSSPDQRALGEGEQPNESVVREIAEETMDDTGCPVLKIAPQRPKIIYSGIDYRGCDSGLQGTQNTGYAVFLTANEMDDIREHSFRTQQNSYYSERVAHITNGEVGEVILFPLSKIFLLKEEDFRNPHELLALRAFLKSSTFDPQFPSPHSS
jgi:hypothetical protein